MRVIKKYSNRRLYDTTDSAYVNLDDVARLIRSGERLQVVDAKTGTDLTRAILLQVLLESRDGAALFPVALLHRIIRFGGDHPLQRAALKQVGAGLELLDAQVSQLERSMSWAGGFPGASAAGDPAPAPAAGAPRAPEPEPEPEPEPDPDPAPTPPPSTYDIPRSSEAPWMAADGPAAAPAASGPAAADPELDALRARLAALEQRLKG